jgi:hypothetical protein
MRTSLLGVREIRRAPLNKREDASGRSALGRKERAKQKY